jgi:hypothetical protein
MKSRKNASADDCYLELPFCVNKYYVLVLLVQIKMTGVLSFLSIGYKKFIFVESFWYRFFTKSGIKNEILKRDNTYYTQTVP